MELALWTAVDDVADRLGKAMTRCEDASADVDDCTAEVSGADMTNGMEILQSDHTKRRNEERMQKLRLSRKERRGNTPGGAVRTATRTSKPRLRRGTVLLRRSRGNETTNKVTTATATRRERKLTSGLSSVN